MGLSYMLLCLYGRVVMFVGAIIAYVLFIIRKREWIKALFFQPSKIIESGFTYFWINVFRGVQIVAVVSGVFLVVSFIIPAIKDITYVRNNEYKKITGHATSRDMGGRDVPDEERIINVLDEKTKETVRINFFTNRIETGMAISGYYLPNTHYGVVTERGDNKRVRE